MSERDKCHPSGGSRKGDFECRVGEMQVEQEAGKEEDYLILASLQARGSKHLTFLILCMAGAIIFVVVSFWNCSMSLAMMTEAM